VHVVPGVDHFIETADVIAMLMARDDVVEPVSGLNPDRLQVGHDAIRPHAGIAAVEKDGRPAGPFHEDAASPPDVDDMDFHLLSR